MRSGSGGRRVEEALMASQIYKRYLKQKRQPPPKGAGCLKKSFEELFRNIKGEFNGADVFIISGIYHRIGNQESLSAAGE
jgi:hypothetical protein